MAIGFTRGYITSESSIKSLLAAAAGDPIKYGVMVFSDTGSTSGAQGAVVVLTEAELVQLRLCEKPTIKLEIQDGATAEREPDIHEKDEPTQEPVGSGDAEPDGEHPGSRATAPDSSEDDA